MQGARRMDGTGFVSLAINTSRDIMKFLGSSTYSASNSSHGEQHMTFLPHNGPGNLMPVRKGFLVLPYSGNNES